MSSVVRKALERQHPKLAAEKAREAAEDAASVRRRLYQNQDVVRKAVRELRTAAGRIKHMPAVDHINKVIERLEGLL